MEAFDCLSSVVSSVVIEDEGEGRAARRKPELQHTGSATGKNFNEPQQQQQQLKIYCGIRKHARGPTGH